MSASSVKISRAEKIVRCTEQLRPDTRIGSRVVRHGRVGGFTAVFAPEDFVLQRNVTLALKEVSHGEPQALFRNHPGAGARADPACGARILLGRNLFEAMLRSVEESVN